jgi:hypothetical protein
VRHSILLTELLLLLFWALLQAGVLYVDIHCDADIFSDDYWEDLPAVAQPYAKQADWWDAYRQAAMRIVARLAKGMLPKPNCTGGVWACLCWGRSGSGLT